MFKQHLGGQGRTVIEEKPMQSLPKSEKTPRSGLPSVLFVGLVISGIEKNWVN